MASTSNPLIGKASGSVGGVTMSSWKGINVIKSKPTSVANPQSDKQMDRRNALAAVVVIFRLVVSAVNAGFKSLAVKQSPYNAFSSYALKNAFTYAGTGTPTLIPANFKFSKGSIADTSISTVVVANADATVTVTFPTTATGASQSASDLAILVAYNEDNDEWFGELTSAARSTGTASIELPSACSTDDTVHVFLGFTSSNGSLQSDSIHDSAVVGA